MKDRDDIYGLKPEAEIDYSEYLRGRLDYKALTQKYDFFQVDKDILLRGSLEQVKENPEMDVIISAFDVLKKYRAGYVAKPQEQVCAIPKQEKSIQKIKTIYKKPVESYIQKKKVWIGGVLGFLFGPLGLFYISWKYAIGVFIGGIIMFLITPYFALVAPFVAFALGVFGVKEYNKKLLNNEYETDFSFGLAGKFLRKA